MFKWRDNFKNGHWEMIHNMTICESNRYAVGVPKHTSHEHTDLINTQSYKHTGLINKQSHISQCLKNRQTFLISGVLTVPPLVFEYAY